MSSALRRSCWQERRPHLQHFVTTRPPPHRAKLSSFELPVQRRHPSDDPADADAHERCGEEHPQLAALNGSQDCEDCSENEHADSESGTWTAEQAHRLPLGEDAESETQQQAQESSTKHVILLLKDIPTEPRLINKLYNKSYI